MLGGLVMGLVNLTVYLVTTIVTVVVLLCWDGIRAMVRVFTRAFGVTSHGTRGAAPNARAQPGNGAAPPPGAAPATGRKSAAPGGQPEVEAPAFFTATQASEQPDDPIPAAEQAPPAEAPVRPRRVHRPRHEERWIGTLVEHGVGEFTDRASGRKYSSYYVRLEADAGDVITRRGVELEQAIQFAGANRGDRIELLFLGREPVEVQDSDPERRKWRNRWRIHVIK